MKAEGRNDQLIPLPAKRGRGRGHPMFPTLSFHKATEATEEKGVTKWNAYRITEIREEEILPLLGWDGLELEILDVGLQEFLKDLCQHTKQYRQHIISPSAHKKSDLYLFVSVLLLWLCKDNTRLSFFLSAKTVHHHADLSFVCFLFDTMALQG